MSIWHQRWNANQIGFHRLEANPVLNEQWPKLSLPSDAKVLVPLCGKSLDLHWFHQQGHTVVGIEMVQKAIEQFFEDASAVPSINEIKDAKKYSLDKIHIYHADFFNVEPDEALFDAWYDRAAMVALPSSMRPEYVKQLLNLTTSTSKGLMVTFDYPQDEMQGPPFALPDSEIEALFSENFHIERLEFTDLTHEDGRDLTSCTTSVFLLVRK